jgi:hypothetical protein
MKISVCFSGNNNSAAVIFNVFAYHINDKAKTYRLIFYDHSISIDELLDSNSNNFHLSSSLNHNCKFSNKKDKPLNPLTTN